MAPAPRRDLRRKKIPVRRTRREGPRSDLQSPVPLLMPTLDYRSPKSPPSGPKPRLSGSVVVGVSVPVLSLVGALVYSGSSASVVAYRLLGDGVLVALWVAG